ncbi:MAG: hypothetical protein ACTH1D_12475, partial [Mycobacteriaceae bacterium]
SEFDLHARAILGLPIDTTLISPGASAVIYGGVETGDGTVPEYSGLKDALSVPETEVRIFGKPVSHERRRMGVAFSTAENIAVARERADAAAQAVTVSAADAPAVDAGQWGRR